MLFSFSSDLFSSSGFSIGVIVGSSFFPDSSFSGSNFVEGFVSGSVLVVGPVVLCEGPVPEISDSNVLFDFTASAIFLARSVTLL